MLEAYCKLKTKLKTSAKLKEALQVICDNLPHGTRLNSCSSGVVGGQEVAIFRQTAAHMRAPNYSVVLKCLKMCVFSFKFCIS